MSYPVSGAGLGLRRSLLDSLSDQRVDAPISFMEVAPENWINVGGAFGRKFRAYTERFPFVCHGLSLSLGGYTPLDETLLRKVRAFLDQHGVRCYSEHLSYCSDDGHLYDLMPIPFTEDATKRVSERIQRAQDILGRRIAVENVSFYAPLATDMSELEFFCEVVERADCQILLDVNNVYVNSINHRYDPRSFIESIPGKRIAYLHIAGHYDEAEDLKVDTHGADVIDPVWALLRHAYATWGVIPTLLERDFNIPAVAELLSEVEQVRAIQEDFTEPDQQRERLG